PALPRRPLHRAAEGPAAPQPATPRQAHRAVDVGVARRGLPRPRLDPAAAHRRGDPRGAEAAGQPLAAGQAVDPQPRPRRRAKKKARDRLIGLAESHPDWVLGYADETWWSRLALPRLHAWAGDEPLHLVERERPRDDSDPKAWCCYGLLRGDTGGML